MQISKENKILFISILSYIVLANIPEAGKYILYPFELLTTWFHEMSHGLMAIIIGGNFSHLVIHADTSGTAYNFIPDSIIKKVFVYSAGYLGSAFFGAVLIILSKWAKPSRFVLGFLSLALLLSIVLFVRNLFGIFVVLIFSVIFGYLAIKMNHKINSFVLNLLAGIVSLNSLADIKVLYSANLVVNGIPTGESDAQRVSQLLYLPSWFWATLWLVFSILLFVLISYYFRIKPSMKNAVIKK